MIKLYEAAKKYQKKRETERRFIKAFENEIKNYLENIEQISELCEKQILPKLEPIGDTLTVHKMNEILESMSKMPLMQAKLIEAFIRFAKACSEVSSVLKGFMEDLKETNVVLYDFVFAMKNTYVEENKVKINGRYYRFFKTYEDEIFKGVKIDDLNEIVGELKKYVRKIEHYIKKTAFIKRNIRKRYVKNLRVLNKASANMIVKRTTLIDLRAYIPEKIFPIAVFFDELSL